MKSAKQYAPWLWLLLVLFCGRIVAQLISWNTSLPFIPPFDTWHSATMPYSWLLASQILIAAAMATTALQFTTGNVQPRRNLSRVLVVVGSIYFGAMLTRLVLGNTLYVGHPWFDKILPTIFHLVLSIFVLIAGRFHIVGGENETKD